MTTRSTGMIPGQINELRRLAGPKGETGGGRHEPGAYGFTGDVGGERRLLLSLLIYWCTQSGVAGFAYEFAIKRCGKKQGATGVSIRALPDFCLWL
jgi:hypothetical protein